MGRRPGGVALVAVAATGIALAESVTVIGTVTKVASDGPFEVEGRGGKYVVTFAEDAKVIVQRGARLSDRNGLPIAILGRAAKRATGANGQTALANVNLVTAVVVGEGFVPPPVAPEHVEKKLAWMTGTLKIDGRTAYIAHYTSMVGMDRPVVRLDPSDRAAVKKNAVGAVKGEAAPATKNVTASLVRVIARDVPAADHRAAFGF